MKELHNFIMNKTNAENVFEDLNRPYEVEEKEIELRLWNQYLNPCGVPRWLWGMFQRNPKLTRDEVITICLEERLIHPDVMIMETVGMVWNVLSDLHDIRTELIVQCGFLRY